MSKTLDAASLFDVKGKVGFHCSDTLAICDSCQFLRDFRLLLVALASLVWEA
jgi:hypothetical protein